MSLITKGTEWKSYVGRQGVILAFDVESESDSSYGRGEEGEVRVGKKVYTSSVANATAKSLEIVHLF